MRASRRLLSLVFVFVHHAVNAGPACDLLLDLRLERPPVSTTAPPARLGLRVDLARLAFSEAEVAAARGALADLDPARVARKLTAASADEQGSAFDLVFTWADLAFLAREPRVTVTSLLAKAVLSEHPSFLGAVEAAVSALDQAGLRAAAARAYAELDLASRVTDVGRLRLVDDGGVETIALDPTSGAPDRQTFLVAKDVQTHAAHLRLMPDSARAVARRLVAARREALRRAWASPQYASLSRIHYDEPVAGGYVNRPIRDFITSKRFRASYWWESFAKFAEFETLAAGRAPENPARITAHTSRSPLAHMFGAAAERVIYWPAIRDRAGIRPELSRMRVAETLVNGRTEAVEVLVNERAGLAPVGYVFLDMGGDLVPAQRFLGHPVAQACARCHLAARGSRETAFLPYFIRTEENLRRIGYRGDAIVKALTTN